MRTGDILRTVEEAEAAPHGVVGVLVGTDGIIPAEPSAVVRIEDFNDQLVWSMDGCEQSETSQQLFHRTELCLHVLWVPQVSPTTLTMVRTCAACPEQYDVYAGDKMVGYIRLRHGWFTVETPDCGDLMLLERQFGHGPADMLEPEEAGLPEHDSDGIFSDGQLRDAYLRLAARKITEHLHLDTVGYLVTLDDPGEPTAIDFVFPTT